MFINRKLAAAVAALTIGVSGIAMTDSAFARGHGGGGGVIMSGGGHFAGGHVGGFHGRQLARGAVGPGFGYYGYDYNGVYDQGNCGIYYPNQPYVNGYTYCD